MSDRIDHIHTILDDATGEIRRYVISTADYRPSLSPGERATSQLLAIFLGAAAEVVGRPRDLSDKLLAVLRANGPSVIETSLPRILVVQGEVLKTADGDDLAAALWGAA